MLLFLFLRLRFLSTLRVFVVSIFVFVVSTLSYRVRSACCALQLPDTLCSDLLRMFVSVPSWVHFHVSQLDVLLLGRRVWILGRFTWCVEVICGWVRQDCPRSGLTW